MKKNKNGFTLIELLAVIVILAIIMVIAIPQILNVINNSRKSSWDNSVKLVARAIDVNNTLDQTGITNSGTSSNSYPLSTLCSSVSNLANVAEIGDIDISKSSCTAPESSNPAGIYHFYLQGKGQFEKYNAVVECTTHSACEVKNIHYTTGN